MHQPVKIVVMSFISLAIACTIIFFYLRSKPKKINYLFILLVLSIPPLVSILRPGTYESGDFSINVIKSMSLYQSFQDGVLLPRWAGELNATFGYPLFLFTYPLPYLTIAFIHFLGISFINSLKILMILSFVGSGITMYYWIKEEVNEQAGIVSAIFYLYAPYHLLDMHYRVDIGELVSFIFMPLILVAVKKIIISNNILWRLTLCFSSSFLILSHQAISLAFFPFAISYAIYKIVETTENRKQSILRVVIGFATSLLLTAFYFIPIIFEKQYTHISITHFYFPNLWQFVISPWRFGLLLQGPHGELSFIIGYVHLLILGFTIILLIKNKFTFHQKIFIYFLSFSSLLIFMMMQSWSSFLWEITPLIKNFQFSYRLLAPLSVFIAAIAGITSTVIRKNILIYFLCLLTISITILNWGNRRTIPQINDNVLREELSLSTSKGEGLAPADPIWTDPQHMWMDKIPPTHLEFLLGKGDIKSETRTSIRHHYVLNIKTNSTIKENTLYFPGWELLVDEKNHPFSYTDKKSPGVIEFNITKGLHDVKLIFKDTLIRKISLYISICTLLSFIPLIYFTRKKLIQLFLFP